ncbi:DUF6491 family protein [Alteriqipengyuania lutimaris]|uniref:Lipoprotein n=1 Tax=Alteriqipengyuania lutimaris TaxID=1538146 RepID=A0A395LHT7_9SPHN|nr:DUF6491 family protein [Alteriqipengyuania lutimaris]MBB3034959.1 hypothetical protein [Alteriqipengyuania lutimaris]RDS76221.1 hypothetical protein DL238_00370 [Alteriqipengyuania lutimaris]
MFRTLTAFATLGCALALASCAPAVEEPPETLAGLDTSKQCFFTRSVRGFSNAPDGPGGRERIFVDTGVNENFVLEPVGTCLDIDFAQRVAIDSRYGPSLCTGELVDVIVPSATRADRCRMRVIGRVER